METLSLVIPKNKTPPILGFSLPRVILTAWLWGQEVTQEVARAQAPLWECSHTPWGPKHGLRASET